VTHFTHSTPGWRARAWLHTTCLTGALLCNGRALAQAEQPPDEIAISAQRQTALDTEALTISETPDTGPHLDHMTAIVGFGPMYAPVYDGSNKYKVTPFPYVDIRGLLNDRLYISVLEGIGVKIINEGLVRAGVSLNHDGGRTSSDDPKLRGLPDVSGALAAQGYIALALRPFSLEAQVKERLGNGSGLKASFGGTYAFAPLPQLHLSLSADVSWANASYQKVFFGITPADAAAASAQGNPLPAYTPGSGATDASITAAGIYQIGKHWGLVGRLSEHDLVGSASKNSPLTQRSNWTSVAVGAMYMF
jgi:outer membrane scaffolding protein for murein synthesis (MipA/OmpV family)